LQRLRKWKENLEQKSKTSNWKVNEVQTKTSENIEQILNFFEIVESPPKMDDWIEGKKRRFRKKEHKTLHSRQKKLLDNVVGFNSLGISTYKYITLCAQKQRVLPFKKETITCLSDLGFTDDQIRDYISKFPRIFVSDSQTIQKNIEALKKICVDVFISKKKLVKQILLYPSIITSNAETLIQNYEDRKKYLIENLWFNEIDAKEQIKKFITLLVLPEKKFYWKIEFFEKLGFSKAHIREFMTYISNFFSRGVEGLQTSCQLLVDFGYTAEQTKTILLWFANVFVSSEKKLRWFLEILKQKNLLSMFLEYPVLFYFYSENRATNRFDTVVEGIETNNKDIVFLVEDMSRKYGIYIKE